MYVEYCKNCGKASGVFELFALPEICMDCHELPVIGHHYNTKTGESITPHEPSMQDAIRAIIREELKAVSHEIAKDVAEELTRALRLERNIRNEKERMASKG